MSELSKYEFTELQPGQTLRAGDYQQWPDSYKRLDEGALCTGMGVPPNGSYIRITECKK